MITILFDKTDKPLYEQIYEYIREEITNGNITYGEKLPSKRSLSAHLSVSVNTVDAAYSQLVAEGYIEPVAKSGYYVCQIDQYLNYSHSSPPTGSESSRESPVIIDFSPADIDYSIFPFSAFQKIFRTTFNENTQGVLKKTDVQGDIGLRRALVTYLYNSRGVRCGEHQIVIGSGTTNLLQTLSMLFGRDKRIVFENPVYLKAYKIFENMGNTVIPTDMDDKGIRMDILQTHPGAAVYITPSHHFPLGMSMPIDRRIQMLNFANKTPETYIIEDDYDSEFRYNEKPLPSLQSIDKSGRVIYIGTFSKSIAPSIRISYMILPEPLLGVYLEKCSDVSSSVSSLEQRMLSEFINNGGYEKHLHKMRKVYSDKRRFLIHEFTRSAGGITIIGESAGHHLRVKTGTGLSEEEMCRNALSVGVRVYPISPYFVNGITPEYAGEALIGYGSLTYEQIREGVELLKKAWRL